MRLQKWLTCNTSKAHLSYTHAGSVYPENPVAPNVKQVCCPAGQTGYPDANQQPACCITGKLALSPWLLWVRCAACCATLHSVCQMAQSALNWSC